MPPEAAWLGGSGTRLSSGDGKHLEGRFVFEGCTGEKDLNAARMHPRGIDRERLTDRFRGRMLRPSDGVRAGQEGLLA